MITPIKATLCTSRIAHKQKNRFVNEPALPRQSCQQRQSYEFALSQHQYHQYHQSTPNHFAISRSISINFPLRKSFHYKEIRRTPEPVDSVDSGVLCPSVASEMPPQRIGLPAPDSGCDWSVFRVFLKGSRRIPQKIQMLFYFFLIRRKMRKWISCWPTDVNHLIQFFCQ